MKARTLTLIAFTTVALAAPAAGDARILPIPHASGAINAAKAAKAAKAGAAMFRTGQARPRNVVVPLLPLQPEGLAIGLDPNHSGAGAGNTPGSE